MDELMNSNRFVNHFKLVHKYILKRWMIFKPVHKHFCTQRGDVASPTLGIRAGGEWSRAPLRLWRINWAFS